METEQLLTGARLVILNEIANSPKSASEIAKNIGTSIAYVDQQLKFLEAYNIIKIYTEKDIDKLNVKTSQVESPESRPKSMYKKTGKPLRKYMLTQELIMITIVAKNGVDRKIIPFHSDQKIFPNIFLVDNVEDMFYISKFILHTDEILEKVNSLGIINHTKDSIELILLTDHIDEIRQKYSNVLLKNPYGKEKKIICWTHNEHEFKQGITKKEKYFLNLLKEPKIIFDQENKLSQLKKERDLIIK
ncbi:MAG: winged helix-turn-helix domain-containing protein [Candidatus Woesearchaeota archaeon]